ncbi:MAG: hypothetical protein IT323_15080 [Anaerolineae bacterium]|nr:hypothetical protein [Anaerolineae bacterium]
MVVQLGGDWHAGVRALVSHNAPASESRPAQPPDPLAHVAGRIRDRYASPSRKAYTYLFWVRDAAALDGLVPTAEQVVAAWVDEGAGLSPLDAAEAVRRCAEARARRPQDRPSGQLSPHERRQMMARAILFTLTQARPDQVDVHLWSRALGFSPKGDRQAFEQWEQTDDGVWFSAYRGE